jgi:hypothetical protein
MQGYCCSKGLRRPSIQTVSFNVLHPKTAPNQKPNRKERRRRQRSTNFGRSEEEKKNLDHFSIYACHPCAGAMLIFSVSFQFYRMSRRTNSNLRICTIHSSSQLKLSDVGRICSQLKRDMYVLDWASARLKLGPARYPTYHIVAKIWACVYIS